MAITFLVSGCGFLRYDRFHITVSHAIVYTKLVRYEMKKGSINVLFPMILQFMHVTQYTCNDKYNCVQDTKQCDMIPTETN